MLEETCQLTIQDYHKDAIICFQILFDLIDQIGKQEIIFGDEEGSWLIGVDEKEAIKCYIKSLAKIATVDMFLKHMIPLIKRDSYESYINNVYKTAIKMATKEQQMALKKELVNRNIKT